MCGRKTITSHFYRASVVSSFSSFHAANPRLGLRLVGGSWISGKGSRIQRSGRTFVWGKPTGYSTRTSLWPNSEGGLTQCEL